MSGLVAVGQSVSVWLSEAGAPERFAVDERRFTVVSKPVMWLDRAPWWELARAGGVAPTAVDLERPIWAVRAVDVDDGRQVAGELERDRAAGRWLFTARGD